MNHHQIIFCLREEIAKSGVWFVDIPRTSSSSIRATLIEKFGRVFEKRGNTLATNIPRGLAPDHAPAIHIVSLIGEKLWNNIFTFSMVRNPWDRFLSLYRFRRQYKNSLKAVNFKEYVMMLDTPTKIPSSPFQYFGYYLPQVEYLFDSNNTSLVDKIYKFEEREAALTEIGQRLGLHFDAKMKIVPSRKDDKPYQEHYDAESREVIAQFFRDDIERFGYSF